MRFRVNLFRMVKLALVPSFLFLFCLDVGVAQAQQSLPKCQSDKAAWDNCAGSRTYKSGDVYRGAWKENRRSGGGEYMWSDGSKFRGQWLKGARVIGHQTYRSGNEYRGEFKNGRYNGKGVFVLKKRGDKYEGQFQNGQYNGQGVYIFRNGNKYTGMFKNGKFNGKGTLVRRGGSTYEGQFNENKRSGFGSETYKSGNKYVGQFNNGSRHGQGTLKSKSGQDYTGGFKNGQFHGQGTYNDGKGQVYVGGFEHGKRSGTGTQSLPNGTEFIGNFRNDKPNGLGTLYAESGLAKEGGMFKDGKLVSQDRLKTNTAFVQKEQKTPTYIVPVNNKHKKQRKIALVIGNGNYSHTTKLENPANDSIEMAKTLRNIGFKVRVGSDLKRHEMTKLISAHLKEAKDADIVLFFYSGHGIQVSGKNYLIPTDANINSLSDVDFELIKANTLTNEMGGEGRVGIVILDACRNNPFAASLNRSLGSKSVEVGQGLAVIQHDAGGLLVAYATSPGKLAFDGEGMPNSPFTTALLKHIPTPGLELQHLMTQVKSDVIEQSKAKNKIQRPWHNTDLTRQVFLVPKD